VDVVEMRLSRRELMVLLGAAVGAQALPAWAAEVSVIEPQPYFASVKRALESLASLGAPIAAADAEQLAALGRQNDRTAVDAAEEILNRYTLATLSIDADGALHVGVGGAQRKLVEQGWRMFLVRLANPAGRKGNLALYAGQGTPGQMMPGVSLAQRPSLMDTLNKAPLIEKMWLLSQLHEATPLAAYGTKIPTIPLTEQPGSNPSLRRIPSSKPTKRRGISSMLELAKVAKFLLNWSSMALLWNE